MVLDMSHVSVLDVSGLEVMEEEYHKLRKGGKHLVLCGLTRQPLRMMCRAGFLDLVRGWAKGMYAGCPRRVLMWAKRKDEVTEVEWQSPTYLRRLDGNVEFVG